MLTFFGYLRNLLTLSVRRRRCSSSTLVLPAVNILCQRKACVGNNQMLKSLLKLSIRRGNILTKFYTKRWIPLCNISRFHFRDGTIYFQAACLDWPREQVFQWGVWWGKYLTLLSGIEGCKIATRDKKLKLITLLSDLVYLLAFLITGSIVICS